MPLGTTVFLSTNHAFERGYAEGKADATRITLGESNYGATQSALIALPFTSFLELRHAIRDKRDRIHGDRPGMAYLWTCELIHIHHNDYGKVAILKCATHWDV